MTPAYDPRLVAVSALALACFSVGFSVTAAAYLGASRAPRTESARAASVAEHAVVTRDVTRGCRLGS